MCLDGVSHLVTLGSPLGVPFAQRCLRNWRWTHPTNVLVWDNLTAKDDFVALDTEVGDDFEGGTLAYATDPSTAWR